MSLKQRDLMINIYIYKTALNSANSELGTIPSRTIIIFKYIVLNLSNPDQKLNGNKIYRAIFFLQIIIIG